MATSENILVRVSMHPEILDWINATAKAQGVAPAEIIRRGLSCVKAAEEQAKRGYPHIGFVADPSRLDVELTGICAPVKEPEDTSGN